MAESASLPVAGATSDAEFAGSSGTTGWDHLGALIVRAQSGAHQDVNTLLNHVAPLIRKHLSYVVRDPDHRKDAEQEALIQIFRALPSFRPPGAPKAWLFRIATRTARHHLRREKKHAAALTMAGGLFEVGLADAPGDAARLRAMIHQLPRKPREAFVLIDLMGFTGVEAQKILGVSQYTLFSRARLARKTLAALYGEGERA